jgi:peptide/nickel transport system substrate-binding protein
MTPNSADGGAEYRDSSEATGSSTGRTTRRTMLHLLGVGGVAGLAGCPSEAEEGTEDGRPTETDSDGSTPGEDTDEETPEETTTFRLANRWANNSIDPMAGHTQLQSLALFETLVTTDYDARLAPGLATDWSVSDDDLTWRFDLREDVTFHDGTAFDAETMAFSLRRTFHESEAARTAGTALSTLPVESVDTPEEYRVTVTMTEPFAPLLAHLTRRYASAMAPGSLDEDDEFVEPIGTGPFQFESWEGGDGTTVLTRFEDYYGEQPAISRVEYILVDDAQTRELMLRNQETDMASQLPPESLSRIEEADNVSPVTFQPPRLRFFTFNVETAPTDELAVRKAFNYGIDTRAIIDSVLEGIETPAVGPWGSQVPWRNDDLEGYDYDTDRAESLLEEAGWEVGDDGTRRRDGEPLALTLWTYTTRAEQELIVEIVQSQLGEIGFDVEVRSTEYGGWTKRASPATRR